MQININLLPEKEKKSPLVIITFIILILFCIAAILLTGILYYHQKETLASVQQRLETTQKVRVKVQEKTQAISQSAGESRRYQSAVDFVNQMPHSTVFLLQHFKTLLPKTAVITNFDYVDKNSIHLIVHFDSLNQAAGFLNAVNNSKYINNVHLLKVTAQGKAQLAEFNLTVNEAVIDKAQEEGK